MKKKKLQEFAWPTRFRSRADREGWNLFVSSYGREIQRDDERKLFPSDEAAIAFVYARAKAGGQHALRALEIQAQDCACRNHDGAVCCPDCLDCRDCPTGQARRYLDAMEG